MKIYEGENVGKKKKEEKQRAASHVCHANATVASGWTGRDCF